MASQPHDVPQIATEETRLQFVDTSATFPPVNRSRREIRLLHLRRSSTKDCIVCDLSVVSLNDTPRYEALSYVWGDKKEPATITVNNLPFTITRNLFEILGNMIPWDTSARPMWVDAICINQGNSADDLEERSHQVRLMGHIYAGASSVTAYLGAPFHRLNLAMKYLTLASKNPMMHIDLACFPHLTRSSAKAAALGGQPLCHALQTLGGRTWWSRIWTVQEYILAQDVVFQLGCQRYQARILTKGIERLLYHASWERCCASPDSFRILDNTWAKFYNIYLLENVRTTRTHSNLAECVTHFHERQCSDPRDKIYGLLGLLTDYEDFVQPDYTKPVQDVFQDFALAWIRKESNLRFLSFIHSTHSSLDLPTWAMDWSHYPYPYGAGYTIRDRANRIKIEYDACLGSQPAWNLDSRPGIVTVNGFLYDTIKTGAIKPKNPGLLWDYKIQHNWLKEVLNMTLWRGSAYGSPEDAHRALIRTLCGDRQQGLHSTVQRNRIDAADSREVDARLKAWWEQVYGTEKAGNHDQSQRKVAEQMLLAVNEAVLLRGFVTTAKGYIGLANSRSKVGDVIAILGGGSVPLILRPVPAVPQGKSALDMVDELSFQVIGDAYIHGIMDGEAVSLSGRSKDNLGRLSLI